MKKTKDNDGAAHGGAPEEVIDKVNNLFRQYGHAINERGLLNLLETMARDLAAVAPSAPADPPASSAGPDGGEAGGGLLSLLLDGEPLAFDLPTPVAVIGNVRAYEKYLKKRWPKMDLGKLLEEQVYTAGGARVDLVATRWTATNARKGHLKHTMAELSALFDAGLKNGEVAPLRIELTGTAAADLARIAMNLGIQPEAWLKAEVALQARRGAGLGDCEAKDRRAATRRANAQRLTEEVKRKYQLAEVVNRGPNSVRVRLQVHAGALDALAAEGLAPGAAVSAVCPQSKADVLFRIGQWNRSFPKTVWSSKRCLKWMLSAPSTREIEIEIAAARWESIEVMAEKLRITTHAVCLACIGYWAFMVMTGQWKSEK